MQTHPTVEIELIASTLRRQDERFRTLISDLERTGRPTLHTQIALRALERDFRDLLDSIERRDLTADQARDHLGWINDGMKRIRTLVKITN